MISFATKRGRAIEWTGTAIVFVIALRYWLWYFDRNANLLDEGSTAAQALRVFNGELIYRDFFTVVTPGSYYTVAWLFHLFGPGLMVLRWAALVTGMGILLVTLVIARRVMTWPFAAAAALMTTVWGWFLVTPNFYSLQAGLFALIALWCYLRYADTGATRWILIAGIITGLTALVKQNIGAYAALAIVASTWLSRIFGDPPASRLRQGFGAQEAGGYTTGMFVAGICIPVVPTLLLLMLAGAGPYLYESWVYYPLARYPERFAVPYPSFFEPLSEHGVFERWVRYVIYLPVVVYPLTAIALVRAREHRHAVMAIGLMGLLLLLQSWPRADVPHILFGLQPTFILFAYLLYLGAGGYIGSHIGSHIRVAIALTPLLVLLWQGYQRTDWEYANYVGQLNSDRGRGVATVPIDAQRINLVTQYIRGNTEPGDPIFVVPWAAGFYFLTDRPNPTRTDFMLFEDPEMYPCLLARLEERRPRYVIYGYTWDVDNIRFREYAAPVDAYIRSRYAIEDEVDGYEVWRRIDATGGAANTWAGACRPRRFRWSDWFGGAAETASSPARSVQ